MRVLIRSLLAAAMLVSIFAAETAQAQNLPFDPSTIDSLSPEQRQQALQSLGIDSNGAQGASSSSAGTLPDVSQLTPDQRQRLIEQLQSQQITSASSSRGYGRSGQYEARGAYDDCVDEQGDEGQDSGSYSASMTGGSVAGRRGSGSYTGYNSQNGGAAQSAYQRWQLRERCRRLEQDEYGPETDVNLLKPFGYDLFSDAPTTFAPASDIPVPSDYVIGPGDALRVQLFGNENRSITLVVNRDGTINMPKLGPISVAGQRFEDVRNQIEDRVEHEVIGTSASVSLGELRSIRVFLLGDVAHPGSYTVSSLATISNALQYAGGVSPIGSLRKIELKRDGQLVKTLDLYDLLLHGDSSQDARLLPGDVVFVPPVGPRIAIAGEVRRPAIYELKGEETLGEALNLAGGVLASSLTGSAQVQRYDANRKRSVIQLDISQAASRQFEVGDGDQIQIRRVSSDVDNKITILGAVRYPGSYEWSDSMSLLDALDLADVPRSDSRLQVYMPLGLIERTNPVAGTRDMQSFNLSDVLFKKEQAPKLQRGDRIIVLSRKDVAFLDSQEVRDVLAGNIDRYEVEARRSTNPTQSGTSSSQYAQNLNSFSAYQQGGGAPLVQGRPCRGLESLSKLINGQRGLRYTAAFTQQSRRERDRSSESSISPPQQCPRIFDRVPEALSYLMEASASVYGEVQTPGLYPVTDGTSLSFLIAAAGGMTREGNKRNIEYVSYQQAQATGHPRYQQVDLAVAAGEELQIHPGDTLNIRPIYAGQEAGTVRVLGEFLFPGTYGVLRDERLSELIRRAGGLTTNAYPYGAVFTRQSARNLEAQANLRAARDLQDAITTAITSGAIARDTQSSAQLVEQIVKRLETSQPIGRVVIEADPTVLQLHPEEDPVLEPGDAIVVPKRPVSVTVIGQVLNPGSVQFVAGKSAADYIQRAGGFSQAADEGRAFVILPNGTAQKLQTSFWNFKAQEIPPGSVIVVPRDAAPFNLMVFSERVFSILGNLALTAAALVTVSKN